MNESIKIEGKTHLIVADAKAADGRKVVITRGYEGTPVTGWIKAFGPKVIVLTAAAPGEPVRNGFDVPSLVSTGATMYLAEPIKASPAKKPAVRKTAPAPAPAASE